MNEEDYHLRSLQVEEKKSSSNKLNNCIKYVLGFFAFAFSAIFFIPGFIIGTNGSAWFVDKNRYFNNQTTDEFDVGLYHVRQCQYNSTHCENLSWNTFSDTCNSLSIMYWISLLLYTAFFVPIVLILNKDFNMESVRNHDANIKRYVYQRRCKCMVTNCKTFVLALIIFTINLGLFIAQMIVWNKCTTLVEHKFDISVGIAQSGNQIILIGISIFPFIWLGFTFMFTKSEMDSVMESVPV
jgi:hypothetical protein